MILIDIQTVSPTVLGIYCRPQACESSCVPALWAQQVRCVHVTRACVEHHCTKSVRRPRPSFARPSKRCHAPYLHEDVYKHRLPHLSAPKKGALQSHAGRRHGYRRVCFSCLGSGLRNDLCKLGQFLEPENLGLPSVASLNSEHRPSKFNQIYLGARGVDGVPYEYCKRLRHPITVH